MSSVLPENREPLEQDLADAPLLNPRTADTATGSEQLTIVLPTREEQLTIAPLLHRLGEVFRDQPVEILIVDDSDTPGCPEAAQQAAAGLDLPVRLLHRPADRRRGGLATAVLEGFRLARGEWVLVMDADLQHSPEAAAGLAAAALGHDYDLLVGTRYAGGGSAGDGLDGPVRVLASRSATRLCRLLFPKRLATVTDPLSGLFAVRRAALDLQRLKPTGFKVLLEILVRHPELRVAEASYRFEPRAAGGSKAGLGTVVHYLRHLTRLRLSRLSGQIRQGGTLASSWLRMAGFAAVGATGIVANNLALWLFVHSLGTPSLVGAALATQVSTSWNLLLLEAAVYRGQGQGRLRGRTARFFVLNNVLMLGRLPVLWLFLHLGAGLLTANTVTLALLFLLRFLVSDRVIYGLGGEGGRTPVRLLVDLASTSTTDGSATSRKRSRHLPYRYDIAGVVRIGSQIMLPELEFFRAQWTGEGELDIAVRVGSIGPRGPRNRAKLTERAESATGTAPGSRVLDYEEHFGRLGANFRITLGDRVDIEVGPLLARSPHVVYTNIVEALLRFVMVSRDRMLLHSACVELDGHGVMLSALTDTGKTGTVLRLLREHGGRFLSDDMTVIDAQGNAYCFPKPLTISAHTLRAVQAEDLTRREWRRLHLQSRLHSKSGRSFAVALSRFNLPIIGINAIVQRLVPPPKYTADRLVACDFGAGVRVRDLFVIERGAPRTAPLDPAETADRLITNTDDAYGFPPFNNLAPSITVGGLEYPQLREREREILESFLRHSRARVLASDTFGWAEEIAALVLGGETRLDPLESARGTVPAGEAWPRWAAAMADRQTA
ncbi:glycosyltransferase [Streptacidiphilus sp. PB12-B1b]|uniref:glycosyltransferase n=1 Tax=Streptacidiphilus sp. PB12-B1b TaxID=2705012 RepID=UPI0015FC8734|nr:glycosyltransferase [Streptacidiphilus sp. PB12-B1b]QMU77340.1 glycosyltransferase [Streptacidiphilus sp. PB12-B1b]